MVIISLSLILFAISPGDSLGEYTAQSEKIRSIQWLQDQRLGTGSQLADFFSDSDARVRERATLACGSIQDTLLLPLLVERLRDEDSGVREAAAFAIGQTAPSLSQAGQGPFEQQCLDLCASGEFPVRLLEELGKFGSEGALARLVALSQKDPISGRDDAMVMGIARFAIRGITNDAATRYLLQVAAEPSEVSWQVVYALQRIVPNRSIEPSVIRPLAAHQDPLVRMNAATLLGKTGDTPEGPTILVKLAGRDTDWRVRVNAIRALGMYRSSPPAGVVNELITAFEDRNEHVALTALSTFGEMLKDAESIPKAAEASLWTLAENAGRVKVSVRRQAEAFTALARIGRTETFHRLARIQVYDRWTEARLLAALGMTGDTAALTHLQQKARQTDPTIASSALEGLRHLSSLRHDDRNVLAEVRSCAIGGLESKDISVLSTAAGMLTDSLIRTLESVPPLLQALERLHEPDDTEAMQQIIQTLSSLRDKRAVPILERLLGNSDRSVAAAAAGALEAITGKTHRMRSQRAHAPAALSEARDLPSQRSDTVRARIETSAGTILLELYPAAAPYTVASFVQLSTEQKFFDGLKFHRVVPNFVVQGGDPRGDGWGGPGYSIRSEFSLLRYERGMLGMASAGKDTEGSQFFITHSPQPHLDGRYTIFGKVRSGMDVVDRLQVGDTIVRITIEKETHR